MHFNLKRQGNIFLLLTLLFSCTENPFISKQELDEIIKNDNYKNYPFKYVTNFVATINNDIYYFGHLDSIPKRLTNNPLIAKTNVRLSNDLTKIVYLDGNGTPVIINSETGKTLETLTNYANVKQLGWINNDKSIYMLIGNSVLTYGPNVQIFQPQISQSYDKVLSFSMNDSGDQAYYIQSYGLNAGKRLKFDSKTNSIDTLISVFQNASEGADYINFYGNEGGFLIGYKGNGTSVIVSVSCFKTYNFVSPVEWTDDYLNTPNYNSDQEVLVYGNKRGNTYSIKVVYLGSENYPINGVAPIKSKTLDNYTSDSPIYIDWK